MAQSPRQKRGARDNFRRVKTTLLEGESTIRQIVGHFADFLFCQDVDLRYTLFVNPPDPLTEDGALGRKDSDLFRPDDARRLTDLKIGVLKTGTVVRAEIPLTVGGVERYYDQVIEPRRDEGGRIVGILGHARDITDHKRVEAGLRESEERFRLVVTKSPNVIGYLDSSLRHLWVANLPTPLTEEQMLGKTDFDLFSREEAERLSEIKRRVLRTGVGEAAEIRLTIGGEQRYYDANFEPRRDRDGRVVGVVWYSRDITERKRAETERERLLEEVQRRAAELDAVVEAVGEAVVIVDGEGRFLRANDRAKEIWVVPAWFGVGSAIAELAGQIDLRYPDGKPMPFEQWPVSRALRGEVYGPEEVIYRRPEGESFHLLLSTNVVRGRQGEIQFVVSAYADITAIRETEQAREEFISVVAHDLRAPLTVITGLGGMLKGLSPDRHGQPVERKAVEGILSSAWRLEKMVADLLDASRIESNRLALAKESVDLPRLVHDVVERATEITRGHPVRVAVHGVVPRLRADPARVEQVLDNLLSNAAKYSFSNTEIVVEVAPRPEDVMVSVTNQGAGIRPEERERIFNRFHRAETARRGEVSGLGLGLYITRGLVEAHGGRVWVESEMGKTTTFRFTLPVEK